MINIKNITKIYNKGKENEFKALNDVNLQVDDGEFVAIMGDSGSGKTTLINIIAGLDLPTTGSVSFDGFDITKGNSEKIAKYRNENIGIIFQKYYLINEATILDNVLLPIIFSDKSFKENVEIAKEMLYEIGLPDPYKKVLQLSGGEQQRVAIIRALINNQKYILADEPTGALDSDNATSLMKKLLELNKDGKTVILVTHNFEIAKMARRIIKIKDGKVVSDI